MDNETFQPNDSYLYPPSPYGIMAEELVDILDEDGGRIGVKTKREAHTQGLWHKAIHIWIYNSKGEVLLQKRAMTKSTLPGVWDTSVAGHLSAGESFEDAAVRELYEELGVSAKSEELKEVVNRKAVYTDPEQGYYNREFVQVYLYGLDELPTKLQKEEVDAVRFISIDRLERELANPGTAKRYAPWDFSEMIKTIRKVHKEELKV